MSIGFYTSTKKVLKVDEGVKPSPYLDSKGFWTIGVGHFIGLDFKKLVLPPEAVEIILDRDIEIHLDLTIRVFGKGFFNSLDEVRQVGLFCLAFNMGARIYTFKETIGLIKQSRWAEAANNLRVSKWARDVDPRQREGIGRDDRIIKMIEFGTLDEAYKI